jgi:hypothetical protein
MVQLAQNIARSLLSVMLSVELFCERIWFFENFIVCDLNNFDVILRNTFLDAYKVYILRNGDKLRVHTKSDFKLVNLDVDYNYALVFLGMNLVALVSELELFSFFYFDVFKSLARGA